MVVNFLPARAMNSARSATSVRMCCASIRTASDSPETSVDVVAANVPPPCSNFRYGPMNTLACRWALLIRTTVRGAVDVTATKELRHVGGKLGMVLEQEPMSSVGVDLDLCTRNQSGEQVGEVRQDHRITVAVGDEHGLRDRAESLQQCVIRYAPCAHSVVLRQPCLPGRWLVEATGLGEHTLQGLLAGLLTRRRIREETPSSSRPGPAGACRRRRSPTMPNRAFPLRLWVPTRPISNCVPMQAASGRSPAQRSCRSRSRGCRLARIPSRQEMRWHPSPSARWCWEWFPSIRRRRRCRT